MYNFKTEMPSRRTANSQKVDPVPNQRLSTSDLINEMRHLTLSGVVLLSYKCMSREATNKGCFVYRCNSIL